VSFLDFLVTNRREVLGLTLEHLGLVGVSTGIAVAIGVPAGILLTRWRALRDPILGLANILQTVPSLALFSFLIPLHVSLFGARVVGGLGAQTAVAALVLYALLPVIRNTTVGIEGVDPAIREAARGMGMTGREILRLVEIPLALGVIVAGIRVATVISVGTATIAAAIDAGGLGRYIFRGLRMNDTNLVLAGAVPAAALALAADFLLGRAERLFAPGGARRRRGLVAAVIVAALALGAVVAAQVAGGGGGGAGGRAAARIAVGSKDFTEQIILGEIVAQAIEARTGLEVVRRFDLGGSLAHQALVAGEIDVYVEYTGTAWTAILGGERLTDPAEVLRRVRAAYAERFDLEWTEPLGFDNTFAILVRGEVARRLGLRTISDAASHAPGWRAGFGQDFLSRADGYDGFVPAYDLRFAERPREMDLSLTYRALAEGVVDLIAGNSTDGLIARLDLVQLADDRRYFPPYDAVPVARRQMLARHPEVRETLRALGGLITVDEMRAMNLAVDGEHSSPREVAMQYLKRKGITAATSDPF